MEQDRINMNEDIARRMRAGQLFEETVAILGEACIDKRFSHTTFCSHYRDDICIRTCYYARRRDLNHGEG